MVTPNLLISHMMVFLFHKISYPLIRIHLICRTRRRIELHILLTPKFYNNDFDDNKHIYGELETD